MSTTENKFFLRDGATFSVEGLADGVRRNHLLLDERLGAFSLQKYTSSLRLSLLHRPRFAGCHQCFKTLEKKAEAVMKSDNCKNRNDIAGESIDIEWFGTCV